MKQLLALGAILAILALALLTVTASAQWDIISSGRLTAQIVKVNPPPPPVPSGFSPMSKTVLDSCCSGAGITLTAISVTMSNGSTFVGTCSDSDPGSLTRIVSTSGGCTLQSSRAYSSADDGIYSLTLNMCQAGQCLNPSGPNFTLTVTGTGSATITPNVAPVADDDVAGHVITGFYLWSGGNIVPWSGTCSWSGDPIVAVKNFGWINDPYGRNGCILELSRNLGSGDDGAHFGAVTNSGGQSTSFTLNVLAASTMASTPPSTINNLLLGVYQDAGDVIQFYDGSSHPLYFTRNSTYTSGCPADTNLDTVLPGRGVIMDWNMATNCSDYSIDWDGMAAGNYDATITSRLQNFVGQHYAQHLLYGIELLNEWQGPPPGTAAGDCAVYGPYWNESTGQCVIAGAITPTQWVNGICRTTALIHATFPGVRVTLQDPAQQAVYNSGTDIKYWPPSLYNCIDNVGHNMYFFNAGNPGALKWQDLTADDSGDSIETVGQAFAWASITGKPYEADEGCDSSNDGYIYPRFFYMVGAMGVGSGGKGGMTAWGIWNSNDAGASCNMEPGGNQAAASNAMERMVANYSYTPGIIPYPGP